MSQFDPRQIATDHAALVITMSLIAFGSVVFLPTLTDMMGMWRISAYQHGWLVPWIALVVLWLRREHLRTEPFSTGWLGFVLLGLSAFAWFVSIRTSIRAIEHLSFVAILVSGLLAVLGWRKFRQIVFPLGLLFAAVPIGDFMLPHLMEWTADISSGLLEIFGIPVWRQGMVMTLPNGAFFVDEVCSGIRYLLASFVSSLLYSYFAFRSVTKRVVFVGVTILSFILLNGLRAFLTMIVANATDMKWFVGRDHIYFGGLLFFCLIVALLFVAEKFSDKDLGVEPVQGEPAPATGIGIAGVRLLLVCVAIVALPLSVHGRGGEAADPLTLAIAEPDGCSEGEAWSERWEPEMVGATQTVAASFRCDGTTLSFFAARYDEQSQGAELISRQNRYWPDQWEDRGERRHFEQSIGGREIPFTELAVETPAGHRVLWVTYRVGEKLTANRYMAKFWQAYYAVRGETAPATLYLYASGPGQSAQALHNALVAHVPVPQ